MNNKVANVNAASHKACVCPTQRPLLLALTWIMSQVHTGNKIRTEQTINC